MRISDWSSDVCSSDLLALPGGGYTSAYWHHAFYPAGSLLTLGAELGYRVIALDRPGYGASAQADRGGVVLDEQVELIGDLIGGLATEDQAGKGFFMIGHHMGGIMSLLTAAQPRRSEERRGGKK